MIESPTNHRTMGDIVKSSLDIKKDMQWVHNPTHLFLYQFFQCFQNEKVQTDRSLSLGLIIWHTPCLRNENYFGCLLRFKYILDCYIDQEQPNRIGAIHSTPIWGKPEKSHLDLAIWVGWTISGPPKCINIDYLVYSIPVLSSWTLKGMSDPCSHLHSWLRSQKSVFRVKLRQFFSQSL